MTTEAMRQVSAGVGALDGTPGFGNYTILRVNASQEPDRYLRIRRAEFTCRVFGAALRMNRELCNKAQSEVAAEIELPSQIVAALEGGDPFSLVDSWMKAWSWMGYLENVSSVACMRMPTWGAALGAFLDSATSTTSRCEMLTSLGLVGPTCKDMLGSSRQTEIHCWVCIWSKMGILRQIAEAAYPAKEIAMAFAKAHVALMSDLDPELARELDLANQ